MIVGNFSRFWKEYGLEGGNEFIKMHLSEEKGQGHVWAHLNAG